MPRKQRKIFRSLLFVALILLGVLMFALGRAPALHGESGGPSVSNASPEISGPVTQRNFNRDHDMTVELISVGPDGFDPKNITRPGGRFLLAINNRSGLEELTVQLRREDGTLLREARVNRKQPNWRSIVNLPEGTYQLTEANHSDWVCRIVIYR